MIEVDIPGVGIVEFPDGMSENDLGRAISQITQPQPSLLQDVGRGIQRGVDALQGDYLGLVRSGMGASIEPGRSEHIRAFEDPRYARAAQQELERQTDLQMIGLPSSQRAIGFGPQSIADTRNIGRRAVEEAIAETAQERAAIPPASDVVQRAQTGDWWEAFKESPLRVASTVAAESLPRSVPILGAAALSRGASLSPAVGAGAGSMASEISAATGSDAARRGYDFTDPSQVRAYYDSGAVEGAQRTGAARGIPIAALDAASMGAAGSLLNLAKTPAQRALAVGAEAFGVQPALGALGEAGAQLTTEGRITDPRDIFFEAIGEIVPGAGEVAISQIGRTASPRSSTSAVHAPQSDVAVTTAAAPLEQDEVLANLDALLAESDAAIAPPPKAEAVAEEVAQTDPGITPERADQLLAVEEAGMLSPTQEKELGIWKNLNNWADTTISESRKRVSSGADPLVAGAHAIKMADWVAKNSVKTYEVFKEEFSKRFPEAASMARDVWDRLTASPTSIMRAVNESEGIDGLNEVLRGFGGSVTSLAYRIGEATVHPRDLERLSYGYDNVKQQMADGMKSLREKVAQGADPRGKEVMDLSNNLSALAMKGQLYNEAREYATGTSGAGVKMRKENPEWVPPMERAVVARKKLAEEVRSFSETLPDARRAKETKWYHGTPAKIDGPASVSSGFTKPDSLFGTGFYMTDKPEIAASYARARGSREPSVYEASVDPRAVLNLEKPLPPEAAAAISDALYPEFREKFLDGVQNGYSGAKLFRDLMESVADQSQEEGIPTSEYYELFQGIEGNLRDAGFDALTHVGGIRVGGGHNLHKVLIMLDPAGELGALPAQRTITQLERRIVDDKFLEALNRTIERLAPDRSQVMEGVTGLPVWLAKDAARLSLQAVRAAYVGTKSLVKAIDAGVKWMQDNGVDASVSDMRAWLESQLQPKRATPEQPTITPQEAKAGEDVLKRVDRIFTKDPAPRRPLKDRIKEATENLRTGWSSKFRPLDRLAEDIGKKYGSSPRRIAHIFEAVKGATGKSEADIYRFDRDVARQVKGLEPEFNQYLFLARTLDRLRADQREAIEADKARDEQIEKGERPDRIQTGPGRRRVSNFTIEDVQAGMRALSDKLGPEATSRLDSAAQSYQEHMDAALRRQVESGRMSQEIYDSIKSGNEFYAPFKLLKYLEVSAPVQGGGQDIDTTAAYTKAIKGIDDADFRLGDIMTASRQNIALSRILSEKNLAMQQFAKVANQDADGVFVEKLKADQKVPLGMELVNVFQNGKVQRYAADPKVAQAISSFHGKTNEAIGKILQAVAGTFRAGVTTGNVAFQLVNFGLADAPRTALVSRFGLKALNPADYFRYPLDIAHGLLTGVAPGMPRLYQDFLDSGAAGSTFQEFLSPKVFEPSSTQKKLLRNVLDTPAKIARAFEEASKITGVKRAMRDTGATSGADLAKRFPEAITEIRRFSGSPDFGRVGSTVEAMKLNLLIMFFNARIQGTVADVGRLMGRDGKKDAARMWGRLGVFVGIPTATLWALNHAPGNDDDYEKRPQWEKDNYWLIPKANYIQSDSGEMVRDYWRIPKRESAKLIANLTESSLQFAEKRDPQAVMDFGVDVLENLSPLNIGGDTAQQKLESAASSLNPLFVAGIETGTGRSLFRHRNIVPDSMKNASPEEQYMERTPQMFRALAQLMPDVAPEVLRSPLMLENLTRNFTGSLLTQFIPDKPVAGREGYLSRTIGRRFHSAPYTDTGAERDEIQRLEREATDEYLKRHRIALQAAESSPDFDSVIQAAIKEGGLDERLLEHTADMWMAERAGITGLDRKILALPAKQRAIYIKTQMNRLGSDDAKLDYMTNLILKRILTDSVMEELAPQE